MKYLLKSLNKTSSILSRASALLVCAAILFMTVMITLNVILRVVFNHPMEFVEEYSALLFVFTVYMGLGYVTRKDMHIRVDLFYTKLSPSNQKILNFCTYILSLIVACIYIYFAFHVFLRSWRLNELSIVTLTPLWIPKFFIVAGLLLFILEILNSTLKSFCILYDKDIHQK